MDAGEARYVLDSEGQVVPCGDPQAWEAWMADPAHYVIHTTKLLKVGRQVRTVFTGVDAGEPDFPVFFETVIESMRNDRHGGSLLYGRAETFMQARDHHARAIRHAERQ